MSPLEVPNYSLILTLLQRLVKGKINPSFHRPLRSRRKGREGEVFLPEGREYGHSGKPATLRVDSLHRNNPGIRPHEHAGSLDDKRCLLL
jgi:hypothetical protein